MPQKVNIKNIIQATFVASSIAIGVKVLLNIYPVQIYKSKLEIPFLTQIPLENINCVAIGQSRINNSTIISFESRSLSKEFAKSCINKGVDFVLSKLIQNQKNLNKNYKSTLNEYNRLLSKIESSNKLDKETLFLITEHNKVLSNLKTLEFYDSEFLNNISDNIELTIQKSIYKNKWRYTLISFLLSFWLAFVTLEYLKHEV